MQVLTKPTVTSQTLMKSQRWFNNMANITFTIPSVLNAGGGEKKSEISANSLQDAFVKISEILGDDFKRRVFRS